MKVRGRRECKSCGTTWSYYDTGDAACPECGSLHSVGLDDERALHTATAATLELTPIRNAIDSDPLRRLTERAGDRAVEFTRGYGFIDTGQLQPLDDTYLAAMELRYVAAELHRRLDVSDEEEWYFTELLRADDGHRPNPEDVPSSVRAARGLAYANAAREYRSDLRTYLDEHPDPSVTGMLERLSNHIRRVRALDGDVPPRESESLVAAARAIGRDRIDDGEGALSVAEKHLDGLADYER